MPQPSTIGTPTTFYTTGTGTVRTLEVTIPAGCNGIFIGAGHYQPAVGETYPTCTVDGGDATEAGQWWASGASNGGSNFVITDADTGDWPGDDVTVDVVVTWPTSGGSNQHAFGVVFLQDVDSWAMEAEGTFSASTWTVSGTTTTTDDFLAMAGFFYPRSVGTVSSPDVLEYETSNSGGDVVCVTTPGTSGTTDISIPYSGGSANGGTSVVNFTGATGGGGGIAIPTVIHHLNQFR